MLPQRQRFLLLVPLGLVLLPFLVWPSVFGFLGSFTDYGPAQLHVHFVGLANYLAVARDPQLGIAFRNIGVFTLVAVPTELAIGFAAAYLLRDPFRGRAVLRVVLLVPWLVSPIASGVMWHFLFNSETGLLNYWLAWLGLPAQPSPLGLRGLALLATIMTDVWRKAPLASFLLLPGLLAIPPEGWEQATLEGATVLDRVRHVALPGVRPLLLTVALLLVGDALGTFDSVLILTGGGPGSATVTPGLYSYQWAFQVSDWPLGATSAWLIVAGVLLIGLIYLRLVRTEAQ
jgi:multiple sugar transport system permease protein